MHLPDPSHTLVLARRVRVWRGSGQLDTAPVLLRPASSPVWTEEKYKKGSRTTIYLIRPTVLDMFKLSSVVFSALVLSAIAAFAPKLVRANPWQRRPQLATDNLELLPGHCIDVIPIAFVNSFSGGIPNLNLANEIKPVTQICNDNGVSGSCASLAAGIQACQAKGKLVTLSLGGGGTTTARFTSTRLQLVLPIPSGTTFSAGRRVPIAPFGAAVLDGVDLDIESGTNTGYAAFCDSYSHTLGWRYYYITAAPQCQFPDEWLGNALSTVWFDAVYVQFYNGVKSYPSSQWNFATWNAWAQGAPNPNVKDIKGAPASTTAANSSEYVSASTLGSIALASRALNSHNFGGGHALGCLAGIWQVASPSESMLLLIVHSANSRFDSAIKNILTGTNNCGAGGNNGSNPCTQTYIVVSGDTCSSIESHTGISDAQLHALNPAINSGCTNLSVGQTLCLSESSSGCAQTYNVMSGDTCSSIESRTGISDAQLHA
ncbi:glycoside hydrolase superfamily [Mycena olivaceomarginata]|nr:glycoside hydrolase superfamily [Mycena olivaceomarginata]